VADPEFSSALEYRFRAIEKDLEALKKLAEDVPETSRLAELVVQRVATLEREMGELRADVRLATADVTTLIRSNRLERVIRLSQVVGPSVTLALGVLGAYLAGLFK
jgi:uncharacterized protein Yka (UPF0111/DUF47 family)